MKKIYILLALVLVVGVGFLVVTQILFRGDYYRLAERQFFYKTCPPNVFITGEYTGATPELAVIKSAVNSLGFEKVGVSQLEGKKIKVTVIAESDNRNVVSENVSSALSKLGDFQMEMSVSTDAHKGPSCPLD